MKKLFVFISLFSLLAFTATAAGKIKMVVHAGDYNRMDCIVEADISALEVDKTSSVVLYELNGRKKKKTACQLMVDASGKPALFWVMEGTTPSGTSRTFLAEREKRASTSTTSMQVDDTAGALILKKNGNPILQYNYSITNPPAGVDKAYQRSGFIHPAYSPSGNILTTIQPKDHYHHYGIWNPWTRMEYGGKMYDLWNLGDKQGTVRAGSIANTYQGDIMAGYAANLDHCIFTPSGEQVILKECWSVKAWNVPGGFLWDFDSYLNPATELPVLLKAYRYAGFGWRATEEWTKENCNMFTSEGKTRQQIDGTTARWIYVTGPGKDGRAGLLLLGHPANFNAPEPLRIWDENANGGRGDAFVNFAPTKNKDWELKPDNQYKLRYRMLAFDGEVTPEQANRLWNEYAYPPVVEFE